MLNRVTVRNFKNIEKVSLDLGRINILIGSNNSGKTSMLQAIQFGVSIAQTTKLQEVGWKSDRIVRSILPNELIYSPLRDVSALSRGGKLKQGDKYTIYVDYEYQDLGKTSVSIAKGKNINILAKIEGKQLGGRLQSMEEPFSIFVPGLAGIQFFEEFKTESIVRKAAARGDANNVFRNILWLLKNDTDGWNDFKNNLKKIFPEIDIEINFDPSKDEHIQAFIKKESMKFTREETILVDGQETPTQVYYPEEQILPIDAVGTGILQAIQILSYIDVYKPKILVLDEPDSHLHPNNQRKILRMILELAEEKDFQVILSTHSRHIIDEISKIHEDVKINWFKDGKIVPENEFDIVSVFLELGALDKGDLLKDGNIKCVVLTEDTTDLNMFETLLKASNFNLDEIDVWSYGGCTKVDSAIILAEFIRKHAPSTQILLHRDRDYLYDYEVEEFKSKLGGANVSVFVTSGTDIESHYINSEHISKLNSISVQEASDLIIKSTKEKEKESMKKFMNSRQNIQVKEARKTPNKVKAGDVWTECSDKYEENSLRYRHGKKVLKSLKNNFQNTFGGTLKYEEVTEFLVNDELKGFAKEIWRPLL